jgi:hypothetical protein
MCKNFKEVPEIWLAFMGYLMRQGKSRSFVHAIIILDVFSMISHFRHPPFNAGKQTQARELLQRSLKSLPAGDHIDTIGKFARLEFKLGDCERGRTLFESILSSHPKKFDVWNVFLDQELRTGDKTRVRNLFERITSLKLSSKKMKFAFKRYLDFEKTEGTEATIQHVKDLARAYVQSRSDAD